MPECPFNFCPGYPNTTICVSCIDRGLRYVADRLYLPKANIPLDFLYSPIRLSQILTRAPKDLREYIKNQSYESKGLYLYSHLTGTGKTTLGVKLLLKFLYDDILKDQTNDDNSRILFLNTVDLLESIRRSMNSYDEDLAILLDRLGKPETAPKLMLMDDIGAEKPSEWVSERLYSLINFRISNRLPVIYTSNLTPEELGDRLGRRIYSRVIGASLPIELSGIDYRIGL